MNLRLKAFLQTTLLMGSAIAMAYVVDFVSKEFDPQTIQYAFSGACIAGLMYMVYSLMLSRLEHFESIKKMTSEYNKK